MEEHYDLESDWEAKESSNVARETERQRYSDVCKPLRASLVF